MGVAAVRQGARSDMLDTTLLPPSWVQDFVGEAETKTATQQDGMVLSVTATQHATLASVRVPKAAELTGLFFQRRTIEAYNLIARKLRGRGGCHAVRFWNFIPNIRARVDHAFDRYMAFNAGRFAAFFDWLGSEEAFERLLAAGTGVGHDGRDLWVHALATDRPGLPIHNPRQHRPYHYSSRYGPFPPCFARATLLDRGPDRSAMVFVGGTASVRGEESVHAGDLEAQTDETFRNLREIIRAARVVTDHQLPIANWQSAIGNCEEKAARGDMAPLESFTAARVYYLHSHQLDRIRASVDGRLAHLHNVEYVRADLCRPELLIEIEGTAILGAAAQ